MFKYIQTMDNKQWYESLNKSRFTPPNYVFGIVWSILYFLMLISFLMIWLDPQCYPFCPILIFFFIQLGLNLIWSPLFFGAQEIKLALYDLILIIVFTFITIYYFYQINTTASYLLIPYIIWLFIAFYFNLYIVINN